MKQRCKFFSVANLTLYEQVVPMPMQIELILVLPYKLATGRNSKSIFALEKNVMWNDNSKF